MLLRFLITALLICCGFLSCSSFQIESNKSLINRLNGRGPIALSTTNAYVAQNLLISEEMERSPEIHSFVKHRGSPAALEVYKEFFSPVNLYFYYPQNVEMFTMVQKADGWKINGPKAIAPATLELVHKAMSGVRGNPKVNFPKSFKEKQSSPKQQSEAPLPAELQEFENETLERIGETDEDEAPGEIIAEQESEETILYNETRFPEEEETPQNYEYSGKPFTSSTYPMENERASEAGALDTIIEQEGTAPAELTPKGDLVHYVTYPGETLQTISLWYTREAANKGRLARMNKIADGTQLELGDVVIVPSYLLKNPNRLTEGAIQKLSKMK